jgi:uncharacterized protein YndB with AHSA1/START domain
MKPVVKWFKEGNMAEGPQISDDAVKAKTGKEWSDWFAILDAAGAQKMSHKEIVAYLSEQQGVGDWWRQMVTVEYEKSRGLRAKHQTTGGYQVSRSKTLSSSADKVFAAWEDPQIRERWLPEALLAVSKATPNKSLRAAWGDGRSRLDVELYPKGEGKTQVTIQHSRLENAEEAERMKSYWGEALERLASCLK